MADWSPMDVVIHFVELGQENAKSVLRDMLDGTTLLLLQEKDLRELGLSLGPVRKHMVYRNASAARCSEAPAIIASRPQILSPQDAEAVMALGLRYADRLLTETAEEGYAHARILFASAAEQGNARAMLRYGLILTAEGNPAGHGMVERVYDSADPYVRGRCI